MRHSRNSTGKDGVELLDRQDRITPPSDRSTYCALHSLNIACRCSRRLLRFVPPAKIAKSRTCCASIAAGRRRSASVCARCCWLGDRTMERQQVRHMASKNRRGGIGSDGNLIHAVIQNLGNRAWSNPMCNIVARTTVAMVGGTRRITPHHNQLTQHEDCRRPTTTACVHTHGSGVANVAACRGTLIQCNVVVVDQTANDSWNPVFRIRVGVVTVDSRTAAAAAGSKCGAVNRRNRTGAKHYLESAETVTAYVDVGSPGHNREPTSEIFDVLIAAKHKMTSHQRPDTFSHAVARSMRGASARADHTEAPQGRGKFSAERTSHIKSYSPRNTENQKNVVDESPNASWSRAIVER